ncbi:esterase OVCA2-like isoform X2 [Tripterygium wilfordii]|uniref:esterase OVCA2-like isoform X2 n=1 Tax=Tripterygium wilfordii TaxID=458696 RepID=UPI0018F8449C|nr:esterase OVCA2-like isoform X2 [Tripterygium wilfordii]
MESEIRKKPRILCLHGFRTSAKILQDLLMKWPQTLLEKLDFDFLNAPFPAEGESGLEGVFDPPYYEWYQSDKEHMNYGNLPECVAYIEDYMVKHGPFDGLLGFSQGAFISATVPGLQLQGAAFTRVPKIKFLILISAAKFKGLMKLGQNKLVTNAFSPLVVCPSVHFIGENDFLKPEGLLLLESFVEPVVIYHPKGHTIPRLDRKNLETMLRFVEKIQNMISGGWMSSFFLDYYLGFGMSTSNCIGRAISLCTVIWFDIANIVIF